jgi:hypothetical protein
MSSTFLAFDSQPNFRSNSTRLWFSDCCLQSRPNRRHCQFFLFGGDTAGLRVAICYEASKCYAPTHNLIFTIESLLWWFLDVITLPSKNSNQIAFRVDFFSLRMLRPSRPKTWVIYRLVKSSQGSFWYRAFLINPLKIWRHRIIAFLHCTIPYASSHKCVYNLEQECKYLMQFWMYPIQPCCHRVLSLTSSALLLLELYLEPHPLDLPRASHALLAIM